MPGPAPIRPGGFHGWGGGQGPTGLTNSPTTSASTATSAFPQGTTIARKAVNRKYRILFATTGLPIASPAIQVAPGQSVTIRGHNGTSAGNAEPCKVGDQPESLTGPHCEIITPDTEISYPVDNVLQIWAAGQAGDGIIISIRAGNT